MILLLQRIKRPYRKTTKAIILPFLFQGLNLNVTLQFCNSKNSKLSIAIQIAIDRFEFFELQFNIKRVLCLIITLLINTPDIIVFIKSRNYSWEYHISHSNQISNSKSFFLNVSYKNRLPSYLLVGRSQRVRYLIAQIRTRIATTRPVIAQASCIVEQTSQSCRTRFEKSTVSRIIARMV